MATAVAHPATPKTTTSVDPLYTQALAQAKASLKAQQAPIQGQQAASDAQFKQRQTDATGVAAALSKLLGGVGPAVNGEYQQGAQNVELAANGFSHGMQDALQGNTDNLNAMLQKLGSPAKLDSHAQEAQDVTYGLGGYIPGTTFSKQGAAFGAAADLQAGAAALKGQENVKQLEGQSLEADKGFQAKLAELAGNLPGDAATNYERLKQYALEDKKFAHQVRQDAIDTGLKKSGLALDAAKYGSSVDQFNATLGQDNAQFGAKLKQDQSQFGQQMGLQVAKLRQDAQQFGVTSAIQQWKAEHPASAQGYDVVGSSKTGYQLWDKAHNTFTPIAGLGAAPSAASLKPRFTASQLQKFKAQAGAFAKNAFWGVTDPKTGETHPPMTYQEAMSEALSVVPLQIAQQALNRYWKKPGYEADLKSRGAANGNLRAVVWDRATAGRGRPMTPYQVRTGKAGAAAETAAIRRFYTGSTQKVDRSLLGNVMAAAQEVGATRVRITSGYRDPQHNAAVGGVKRSNHMTGHALDGEALINGKWVPLGAALKPVVDKFGLRSGDVPGFFNGGPDPVHVDDGANQHPADAGAPAGIKMAAFSTATARYGWKGKDLQALDQLWQGESGWNPYAKNPSSGALGIPQALGHTLPADYAHNPSTQIEWGLDYIKQRYGSPAAALKFWLSHDPHWY